MLSTSTSDPRRVVCSGLGLGYVGEPAQFNVDARRAGPGELVVFGDGPQADHPAVCDVSDLHNGTYTVHVTAVTVGRHSLHVRYADQQVPGSPFVFRVSSANQVKVSGPGLEHGVFSTFNPAFVVDATDAAGPGEIKVRVGGQPGTFKVQTKATGRRLRCSYNAMAAGLYSVHITWSDDPVPGSPFQVSVFETEDQLRRYIASQQAGIGQRDSCTVS